MTNYIRELSGKQYLKRIKDSYTAIVPIGACEIYGTHLPMGQDLIVAKRISELVAEKTGALIAPTIEIGESSALDTFQCTFSLPRNVIEEFLDYLVGKLLDDGFKNILFLSGHAGNVEIVNYVVKRYQKTHEFNAAQVDWWRFTQFYSDSILDFTGPMAHGHAAECGTSVMLYLYPELVDLDSMEKTTPKDNSKFKDIITIETLDKKTENGTIGDPRTGSKEKGEKIVNTCVNRIVEYMNEKFTK